jgi:hypothetical protein
MLLFTAILSGAAIANTHAQAGGTLNATFGSPTIDGNNVEWAALPGLNVTLKQFDIPAGSDWEYDPVAPKTATLKVANDSQNIYVLLEVEDTYDYVAADHGLSAAIGIMFILENAAGPHMGSGPDDLEGGLGMVDIWHWELDCGPGAVSGTGAAGSGDDPDCNLDDEYATDPESREDDDQTGAENSIAGSWSHTAGAIGGSGKWIFEMKRPLNTGDSTDAQFTAGGSTKLALAYWDPKESAAGWSDAGHLTSADSGWIQVNLASQAAPGGQPTTPPSGTTPSVPSVGTAGLAANEGRGGTNLGWAALAAVVLLAIPATTVAYKVKRDRQA